MDEIIRNLTHQNELFEDQWSETYDSLKIATTPDQSRLVLLALVDYILVEPIDPPPCDGKYCFITMVIDCEISFAIEDLVDAFTRVLNSPRTDQWSLHFLESIYDKYRIGERLSEYPMKIQLIEKILQSLQTKLFEGDDDKWKDFLIEHVFSDSTDDQNRLNQLDMQTTFPTFCTYAIQQSQRSAIWLQIITILNLQIPNEELLAQTENFIQTNQYENVHRVLLNLDLAKIDLERLLRRIIQRCSVVEEKDIFVSNVLDTFVGKLEDIPVEKNLAPVYFDFILAILKLRVPNAPKLALCLLRKRNFYSWKDLTDGLVELIRICISYDELTDEKAFSELEDIVELIPPTPNLSKLVQPMVLEAICRWSDKQFHGGEFVYRMGKALMNLINPQQITLEICLKFIEILQNRIDCNDEEINQKRRSLFWSMPRYLADSIEQLKRLSFDIHSKLAKLLLSTLDHPFHDERQSMTFEYALLATILFKTALTISHEKELRLYEIFLDRMYQEAKNENETNVLYQWWSGFWLITGQKFPDVACDHIEQLLDFTFNQKGMNLIGLLISLCTQHSNMFCNHFDAVVDTLVSDNRDTFALINLFILIVSKHPEIVSSKHLHRIFSSLETSSFNDYWGMIIQNLSLVANYQPDLFDCYREIFGDLILNKQSLMSLDCFRKYLIASMIIHQNENRVNDDLNLLIEWLKNKKCSTDLQNGIVYTCLLIGLEYKQILTHRREDFVKLKANLLVNYIDNTTSSKIEESTIRKAQEEMELIEQNIKKENSGTVVPLWGREFTRLLNPRSSNDWRLLAQRLGFSASEIKHWALQTDPCMALLNEWFSTHRTDDAMHSLAKVLGEINRHDAEQIIRQALPTTGQIGSTNLKRLPPVLLSCLSKEQVLIIELKDRLKEAGYFCQMDDEQTSADTHIRGAKVVICCIDPSYVQSENCAKQFHWILQMKKPFILLYTEEQAWPPAGTLQSKLREYLYIPFSRNAKNESNFMELLGQIRYYVAPDPDLISEHYRHWFVPRLDTLIFLKSTTEREDIPLVVSHPQILLSYPWDQQQDAVRLYQKLTQLGYRTWLDIFQMGGGDSLVEKCNTAIGQSSCLLACITPKYTKSIQCQQQFSQAKDLNKPIVCLLLEETNPWPPTGVNLSVFAGKSSIDFRDSNDNNRWTGKPFELLLAQLRKIIPNVQTDKPRHLLEMQRPTSASRNNTETNLNQQSQRRSSAPIIPKSRACSLM